MSSRWDYIQTLDKLRSSEQATAYGIRGVGDKEVVLLYPSPYRAAMSSLGYQSMYKVANTQPGWRAARATLPDDAPAHLEKQLPILTIEDERPIAAYPVIAVSVAYELEIPGLIDCLRMANLEALTKNRQPTDPLIIAGGPLTFSNPLPMGPFVDIVCMGEGEDLFAQVLQQHQACHFDKAKTLDALHDKPGIWIPDRDGDKLVPVAKVAHKDLPARSAFITPHTELSSMFMTEAVRGCSRGCTYCVMRRSTNGGMRMVDKDVIIDTIPDFAKRVGLVGASVTDHPQIVDIVRAVVEKKGCEVGISSLRADKMTDELASLLVQGGYRTLTVAADGASQRMRNYIERKTKTKHLLRCAEIAKTNKLKTLKMYLMVGIPTETTEDLDELVTMTKDLRNIFPKIAFGIAPFVAKRNTPLDGTEFAGIKVIEKRIGYLRKHLKGAAEIRPTSARWAWVEYILAQGGQEEGLAVLKAHLAGGRFADYKKAFADIKQAPRGRVTFVPAPSNSSPSAKSAYKRVKITLSGQGVLANANTIAQTEHGDTLGCVSKIQTPNKSAKFGSNVRPVRPGRKDHSPFGETLGDVSKIQTPVKSAKFGSNVRPVSQGRNEYQPCGETLACVSKVQTLVKSAKFGSNVRPVSQGRNERT